MYDNFTHLPNVTPEQAAYQARVEYFSKRAPIGGEWVISNLEGKVICRTSQPFRVAEYNPDMVKVESSHLYEKRIARMGLTEVWDDGEFSGYASADITTLLPDNVGQESAEAPESVEVQECARDKRIEEYQLSSQYANLSRNHRKVFEMCYIGKLGTGGALVAKLLGIPQLEFNRIIKDIE